MNYLWVLAISQQLTYAEAQIWRGFARLRLF